MKFLHFFPFFGANFGLPGSGSDPDFQSGSLDPIETGLNSDPRHWSGQGVFVPIPIAIFLSFFGVSQMARFYIILSIFIRNSHSFGT
jgi:hypothetical protein